MHSQMAEKANIYPVVCSALLQGTEFSVCYDPSKKGNWLQKAIA